MINVCTRVTQPLSFLFILFLHSLGRRNNYHRHDDFQRVISTHCHYSRKYTATATPIHWVSSVLLSTSLTRMVSERPSEPTSQVLAKETTAIQHQSSMRLTRRLLLQLLELEELHLLPARDGKPSSFKFCSISFQ